MTLHMGAVTELVRRDFVTGSKMQFQCFSINALSFLARYLDTLKNDTSTFAVHWYSKWLGPINCGLQNNFFKWTSDIKRWGTDSEVLEMTSEIEAIIEGKDRINRTVKFKAYSKSGLELLCKLFETESTEPYTVTCNGKTRAPNYFGISGQFDKWVVND